MALKPFEFFRKRTKVFMAVLVFVAMFSFILMDALGSQQGIGTQLAMRIRGWFGVVENQIADVEGLKVDPNKIFDLQRRRQVAASLVQAAMSQGRDRLLRDSGFSSEDLNDEKRFRGKLEQIQKDSPEVARTLQARPNSMSSQLMQALQYEQYEFYDYVRHGGSLDAPFLVDMLLEHTYWIKRADELGIVLSMDRLKEDLIKTASSKLKEEEIPGLVAMVAKNNRIGADMETMLGWLGDEIRAMMAKGVMRSPNTDPYSLSAQRSGLPGLLSTQATPLDLWDAYVKVKTQLTVGVLPIRVSDKEFTSRVPVPAKGSAEWQAFADSKLKPLFEKYKDNEPDPAKDTPGFKIPKKYQIEFVYGDLQIGVGGKTETRKFYEQSSAAQDALLSVADVLGLAPLPMPIVQARRASNLYEINKGYGRYRLNEDPASALLGGMQLADGSRYQLPLRASPEPFKSAADVHRYTAAQNLLDVAAALNQSPAGLFSATAVVRPMPRKVARTLPQAQVLEVAAAFLGQGVNIGVPELSPAFLSFAARVDYKGENSTFADVAPQIFDELIEEECRVLISRDLRALEKDLSDYGKFYRAELDKWRRTKANAEARGLKPQPFNAPLFTHKSGGQEVKESIKDYVTRFAKVRGMEYKGMDEPRSEHDLFEEKGATPLGSILKPVYVRSMAMTVRKPEDDIKAALTGRDTRTGTSKSLYEATQLSAPTPQMTPWSKPWEHLLHWKIAETEPLTPSFADSEDRVLEAWKQIEARALVQEHAEKLAKQVKGEDGDRQLRDTPGYYPERYLGRYESLGPFSYRKMDIQYIEMPPEGMVEEALTKLREKHDTVIVANQPKSIYYLFVLKERKEPQATNPLDLALFDSEVVIHEPARQMKVDNQPLSQWVISERTREFQKSWDSYFRERTKYDKAHADMAQEALRSKNN